MMNKSSPTTSTQSNNKSRSKHLYYILPSCWESVWKESINEWEGDCFEHLRTIGSRAASFDKKSIFANSWISFVRNDSNNQTINGREVALIVNNFRCGQ
jgi:hypothetical protein